MTIHDDTDDAPPKIQLKQTCGACPEQYDAYYKGRLVGFLHLRHSYFSAEYQGRTVYSSRPNGDGIFDPDERDRELNNACKAILAAIAQDEKDEPLVFEIDNSLGEDDA